MRWLFEQGDCQTPGLAFRLHLCAEVTLEELPGGGVIVSRMWHSLRLNGISPVVATTLKRLSSGWVDRKELLLLAAGGSGNAKDIAASLSEHIWALDQLRSLCRVQLVMDDTPLLTVEPVSYTAFPAFGTVPEGPRLSRFAYLQGHKEGLAMESAVGTHRIILHDTWGVSLILLLAREGSPLTAYAPSDEATRAAIGLLDAAGMLEGREQASAAEVGDELLRMGEFHDLLFHRRSRFGRHDGSFGAEFPYLDKIPPLPALAAPLAGATISLPSPAEGQVRAKDLTLTQALERRASVRTYSNEPVTLAQLGEFLFRCARARAQYGPFPKAGMPYEASDRPYPSGGGIHDLELYLIVSGVQGLPTGAYHYAADRHALEVLNCSPEDAMLLLKGAMRASGAPEPPHLLIKISSRFGRMSWKYRSISYATTLKNVGVLFQTMYLVATAMGLAACALGSGDDIAAERALKLAARSEIAVGEFMLGNPATGTETGTDRRLGLGDPTWVPLVEPNWWRDL